MRPDTSPEWSERCGQIPAQSGAMRPDTSPEWNDAARYQPRVERCGQIPAQEWSDAARYQPRVRMVIESGNSYICRCSYSDICHCSYSDICRCSFTHCHFPGPSPPRPPALPQSPPPAPSPLTWPGLVPRTHDSPPLHTSGLPLHPSCPPAQQQQQQQHKPPPPGLSIQGRLPSHAQLPLQWSCRSGQSSCATAGGKCL